MSRKPTKTQPRAATSIDANIGSRIRARRFELDISQMGLGATLGVSFQQIQKYEAGKSRLAASRLPQLSEALQVGILYFFAEG